MIKSKKFFLALSILSAVIPVSQLLPSTAYQLIAPEIKNDDFYQEIYNLAKSANVQTILEIGSSSGEGSTQAFVKGIQDNPHHPVLFCMEVSKVRFDALQKCYADMPNVKCYNVSSVPLDSFPSAQEVTKFYKTTKSNLNGTPLEKVLDWLKNDIEYVGSSHVPETGIEIIKKENNLKHFDMVLIDGSEFTGKAELDLVYGAKYILLDDIKTYKNYENYKRLRKDTSYKLIKKDNRLRNGFAIFEKI